MQQDELELRLRQIEGFVQALTQQCHLLDERRHLLAPLLQDIEVQAGLKRKLDKTSGAGAWSLLAPLLAQDLLRDQARLFLDDDKRSGSLLNLWRKLHAHPGIRKRFKTAYIGMHDGLYTGGISDMPTDLAAQIFEKWRQEDRDRSAEEFDQRWHSVEAAVKGLMCDPVAGKIKTFRDKYHAHFEMQKLDEEPKPFDVQSLGLTFDEVIHFGDQCQKTVAELGLLLTGVHWDPEQFAAQHAEQGASLWRILSS